MKAKYDNQTSADEAFFGEAETHHSGTGTHTALDATNNPFAGTWVTGTADTTANQEALGATVELPLKKWHSQSNKSL